MLYLNRCIKKIISEGHKKHGTTELNNAMFVLTNVENNIVGYSNIDLGYLCAEELWYSMVMKN